LCITSFYFWNYTKSIASHACSSIYSPSDTVYSVYIFPTKHSLRQRFSIHVELRTPSGRKNHFCTPCTIWCIVFCIIREVRTEKFAPQEDPSRTPRGCRGWEHPQLRTAALRYLDTSALAIHPGKLMQHTVEVFPWHLLIPHNAWNEEWHNYSRQSTRRVELQNSLPRHIFAKLYTNNSSNLQFIWNSGYSISKYSSSLKPTFATLSKREHWLRRYIMKLSQPACILVSVMALFALTKKLSKQFWKGVFNNCDNTNRNCYHSEDSMVQFIL